MEHVRSSHTPSCAVIDEYTGTRGRYFVGPDKRSYKWKLEPTHCWVCYVLRLQFLPVSQENRDND